MLQLHQVLDQQDDRHDIKLDQFLFQHQSSHQVQHRQDHSVQHRVKRFLKEADDTEDGLRYPWRQYQVELRSLDQPISNSYEMDHCSSTEKSSLTLRTPLRILPPATPPFRSSTSAPGLLTSNERITTSKLSLTSDGNNY